ncbi:MAG: hypothetical protein AAGJ35_12985, partial [Myxococcota bacterium]
THVSTHQTPKLSTTMDKTHKRIENPHQIAKSPVAAPLHPYVIIRQPHLPGTVPVVAPAAVGAPTTNIQHITLPNNQGTVAVAMQPQTVQVARVIAAPGVPTALPLQAVPAANGQVMPSLPISVTTSSHASPSLTRQKAVYVQIANPAGTNAIHPVAAKPIAGNVATIPRQQQAVRIATGPAAPRGGITLPTHGAPKMIIAPKPQLAPRSATATAEISYSAASRATVTSQANPEQTANANANKVGKRPRPQQTLTVARPATNENTSAIKVDHSLNPPKHKYHKVVGGMNTSQRTTATVSGVRESRSFVYVSRYSFRAFCRPQMICPLNSFWTI